MFKVLHWLKLNHVDYYDSEISDRKLASYSEESPPVVVDYHPSSSNKNLESSMPLLSMVRDAPWQIIDKKKKREVKIETASIQSGFVAAKGSVSVKSERK